LTASPVIPAVGALAPGAVDEAVVAVVVPETNDDNAEAVEDEEGAWVGARTEDGSNM
jgi:hypothetical protein